MVWIKSSLAQLQDHVQLWMRSQPILRWGLCLGLGLLLAWSLSPRALSQDAPLPAPPPAAPSLDTQELLQPPSTPLQPLVPGAPLPNSAPPGEFPTTTIPPLRDDQVQADPAPADTPLQLDTGVGREIVIEKQSPDQAHEFREGEVPIVLMERSSGSIVRITPKQGIEVISPTPPPTPLPLVPFTPGREDLLYPLPAPVPITSGFGMRTHPISGTMEFHQGVDLGAPLGTPILAAFSGQVVQAGVSGGLGNVISLDHGNKRTRYGHMEKINVVMGETVAQGSVVGYVGSTGLSTGPHLHFELWQQAPTGGWVALDSTDLLKVAMAQAPS